MITLSKTILVFSLLASIHIISALSSHEDDTKQESPSWATNYQKHKNAKEKSPYHPNPGRMTCDKYPRVCHVKGSPGHDCCKKKCVDVRTDNLNCGMCGNKCKYPEVCCKGRCVNTLRDRKHCGRCENKCQRGNFCSYGMCSYA